MASKIFSGVNKLNSDTIYIGRTGDGYKTIIADTVANDGYQPAIRWDNLDWVKTSDGYTWNSFICSTENLRPAYDENHIYAWDCSTTDGSSVAPNIGSISLISGAGKLGVTKGYIYRACPSLININDISEENLVLGATVSIDTSTTSYTIELLSFVSLAVPQVNTAWGSYPVFLGLVGAGPNGHQFRHFNNTSPGALVSLAWVTGAGKNETSYPVGISYGNIPSEQPHHFMIAWNHSTSTSTIYIDGKLVKTGTAEGLTGTLTTFNVAVPARVGSIADVRISNIVRSQNYAVTATRAMKSM
jgi:hypothetical protein